MRLTIVVPDSVVGIDGEFRQLDLSQLPENIRAVQWDGAKGHVEFNDETPNEIIDDISMLADVVSAWNALNPPTPTPPTLADLKELKYIEINQSRLIANLTTFTHGGKVFACDQLSRSDIDAINGRVATRGALPNDWVGGWKAIDNTYVSITTIEQWNDFYDSMVAKGQANFAKSQSLKAQLTAASTAEQVAAITW